MKRLPIFLLILLLAACLDACRSPAAANAGAQPMELKLYTVPPAQTGGILGALQRSLHDHGQASSPAPGKLLVYAPGSNQASIADAIEALSHVDAGDNTPARLQVNFWVVQAVSGAGTDSAQLKPLAAALHTLRESLGAVHFVLQGTAASVASPDGSNNGIETSDGRSFGFSARMAERHRIALSLQYHDRNPDGIRQLDTQTSLSPGEYVVLASAPQTPATAQPATADPNAGGLQLLVARVDSAGQD